MRPSASELLANPIFDAIREKSNETVAPYKVSLSFDKKVYNIDYTTEEMEVRGVSKSKLLQYFISKCVEESFKK